MGYKTTDGLMRHLRENGVQINGSKQKRQLINTGYYHGYKGYRFLGNQIKNCLLFHMTRYMPQFNMILS